MRFIAASNAIQALLFVFSCLSSATVLSRELLQDPEFSLGFQVLSPFRDPYSDRAPEQGVLSLSDQKSEPAWELQQWTNLQSIIDGEEIDLPQGGKRWQNSIDLAEKHWLLKSVTLAPSGSPEANVVMELNGLAQYAISSDLQSVRQPQYIQSLEENWPHLLIQQNFTDLRVGNFEHLFFAMEAKLLFDQANYREGYTPELHAGRFVVSFIVQNTLSRNFFWLILPIYDDRMEISPFGCKKCRAKNDCRAVYELENPGEWLCPFDGGLWKKAMAKRSTFKMIFRVGSREFMDAGLSDGQWHTVRLDLMPVIKEAVRAARQQIKPKGFSESLDFYRLASVSLGWEMNGFNHAALQFRGLSLRGERRDSDGSK